MFKIAFFGSDSFSLASFRAIVNSHRVQPNVVQDVCLITRKLKPAGRGMKTIFEPQIVAYAKQEQVDWHEVEEVSEFDSLEHRANLAVAVSYGRLIPGTLINSLEYGGINVHPSSLPKYRGASPLQYAIMNQDKYSGVSVQTLHPTRFDHGHLLWQSNKIPLDQRETTETLTSRLAQIGAQGLLETLQKGDIRQITPLESPENPSKAPILSKDLYEIDFNLDYDKLDARGRALSKLWFTQKVTQKKSKGKPKGHPMLRVNLKEFREVHSLPPEAADTPLGTIVQAKSADGETLLASKCNNGYLGAAEIIVQGFKSEPAEKYFAEFEKRKSEEVIVNN